MFIKIDGFSGKQNCIITEFYKSNLDELKYRIKHIYEKEFLEDIPKYFNKINTIKDLKSFVKIEMYDMDKYPYGFKHIDGIFCLYEAIG